MKKLILSLSVVAMMGVLSLPVFASTSVDQQETRKEDDKKCDKDAKKCDKKDKKCDKKDKKSSCCSKGKKAE